MKRDHIQTHESFYNLLKTYAKRDTWLKLQCFITIDQEDELIIFDPQLEKKQPTKQ
jgi:hypothetical protein